MAIQRQKTFWAVFFASLSPAKIHFIHFGEIYYHNFVFTFLPTSKQQLVLFLFPTLKIIQGFMLLISLFNLNEMVSRILFRRSFLLFVVGNHIAAAVHLILLLLR